SGGTRFPPGRATAGWEPARYDRAEARARLGVGPRPVVMFLGTPRGYKGVDDLVTAVERLGGDTLLVLVGADLESVSARRWAALPHVKVMCEILFDDVPRYLIAADVLAVPQLDSSATVGQ